MAFTDDVLDRGFGQMSEVRHLCLMIGVFLGRAPKFLAPVAVLLRVCLPEAEQIEESLHRVLPAGMGITGDALARDRRGFRRERDLRGGE